jgi:hypothetical protein
MSRKTFKVNSVRYVKLDGKQHYGDADGNPIILPPQPDGVDRYVRDSDGKYDYNTFTPEWKSWCEARDEARKLAAYVRDVPLSISFSHMDCKDGGPTFTNQEEYTRQPKNQAILEVAQFEYLTKVRALQKEIREKFGPQLELKGSDVEPDEDLKKEVADIHAGTYDMFSDIYYH